MKKFILAIVICSALRVQAQQHKLQKLWETDSVVAVPESVLPDVQKKVLYISLIDGGPWDADGKGGIGRLSADGSRYDSNWVTGLNAPKGLGRFGNTLYAADISDVVVIDIAGAKVIRKIPIEGASGLNDITVTDNGVVFVSDSKTSRIWRIENQVPSLYLENISGANGLLAVKNDLILAKGPSLLKADAQKRLTSIAELPQPIDGIEPVGNGDYLVTAWSGYIFYVYADGRIESLLDTHLEKKNTADIGYDPTAHILYVPTFFARKIVAYRVLFN
jgi:hypothetical protein